MGMDYKLPKVLSSSGTFDSIIIIIMTERLPSKQVF